MFACLSNLKQSCRGLYVEQKLFCDQLMKMCTTCPKRSHKSALKVDSTLKNISKYENWVSVSCTLVESSVVCKPSRTSSSSNCKSCSSHVDVQLCQLHLELYHHGLGVNRCQNSPVTWTRWTLKRNVHIGHGRPATEVVRRVAPRVAVALPA